MTATPTPLPACPVGKKANIRANKPVPERRTQLHAVAQEPRDDHLDETKCDGAGQSDTSTDTMELPTDQKVGDSSSSERASKSPGSGLPEPRSAVGRFARPYKNPYSCRDELDL